MIIDAKDSDFNSSTTIVDGERFEINGLNIWDHRWDKTGDQLIAFDAYGKKRFIPLVKITDGLTVAEFGAEEVSNCVWMICHKYF